ncbi:peptidase S8/S53 domain-containing protein [Dichotomocladium elegans]|nr:peptidase S8/S53 domain-containing protein [Dichotomocladium elegans]
MKPSAILRLAGLLALALGSVIDAAQPIKRSPDRRYYTLYIPSSKESIAIQVADALGVRLEGTVGELTTYYMVSTPGDAYLHKRGLDETDPVVATFNARKQHRLAKRDDNSSEAFWDHVHRLDPQVPKKRVKRSVLPEHLSKREPPFVEPNPAKLTFEDAQETLGIHDPGFLNQWHLVNQENFGNDINVTGVWKQGITGNGSIVVILDDGLDFESKDLAGNFYSAGSYDFNDHTDLPKPRLIDDTHGTRCAGQIAAMKNDVCGLGIAYDGLVAGVRILSAEITDADEAAALNYKFQENQIFSCSWGPPDNGETMEAPEGILADAFINGIENGRDGKGSIYVFATGNGALSGDNCNFDGYTNSIYTITVGAIDHTNGHPPYSESCSAQMVVTYSSGAGEYIFTTTVGANECSDRHGGTSAAAPNAAGIFALVLSVRPELTWRDLQHLCVQTAIPISLNDEDWKKLPSGRMFNHKYGYGKLDAYAIVEAAKTFELVNKQTHLELPVNLHGRAIPQSTSQKKIPLHSTITVTEKMIQQAGLKRLEHVTATVNIEHQRRGDLVIILQSPNKVESELATMRPNDASTDGIQNWKFMSVKHWDENPIGDWVLLVYDASHPNQKGIMLSWTLTLWGELDPAFEGEPIHNPLVQHNTTVSDAHSSILSSHPKPTTTSDHVPARPTRLKSKPATTSVKSTAAASSTSSSLSASATEGLSDEAETKAGGETSASGSTIIYAVVGTGAIIALATGLYVQKRKTWQPSSDGSSSQRQQPMASGYEFSVLRRSEEDEDDDFAEESDGRPLLSENVTSRSDRS